MTGLADVDGFKICIQVCMWPDVRQLSISIHKTQNQFPPNNLNLLKSLTKGFDPLSSVQRTVQHVIIQTSSDRYSVN